MVRHFALPSTTHYGKISNSLRQNDTPLRLNSPTVPAKVTHHSARFRPKRKENEGEFADFVRKSLQYRGNLLSLQRFGGEIPSRRCISFYFALYRKDLGNLFGIVRMKKQREKPRMAFPPTLQLCTRLWRGCILICWQGFQFRGLPLR